MLTGLTAQHTIGIVSAVRTPNGRGGYDTSWEDAPSVPSEGWAIDAGDTSEDTENRDASEVSYTLRGPIDAPVTAANRVRVFGKDFEIEGDVLFQPGPSDLTSHCIIRLKRGIG